VASGKPAIVAVDGDRDSLEALERDVRRRFGADYDVVAAGTPDTALDTLERLAAAGEQVALLMTGQWLPGMTGVEFLVRAHERHPDAKRVLFITYGAVAAGRAGLHAMASANFGLTGPLPQQTLGPPAAVVRSWGRRRSPPLAGTTSPWWAEGRQGSPRRYTARRKACAPCCWNQRPSEVKRGPRR